MSILKVKINFYMLDHYGYKNFEVVAKSFCELIKTVPCAKLVIAGSPPSEPELNYFYAAKIELHGLRIPQILYWKNFMLILLPCSIYQNMKDLECLYLKLCHEDAFPLPEIIPQ